MKFNDSFLNSECLSLSFSFLTVQTREKNAILQLAKNNKNYFLFLFILSKIMNTRYLSTVDLEATVCLNFLWRILKLTGSSEAKFLNLFIVVLTAAFQGYVNSVREHQVWSYY